MFVVYENATKNEHPLMKNFYFDQPTDVEYDGKIHRGRLMLDLAIKKGGKVKATNHPSKITGCVEGSAS